MTEGQEVARRFKAQYFTNGKWATYPDWEIQPEQLYIVLRELTSKEAVRALGLDSSWTRPKRGRLARTQHITKEDDK